MSWNQSLWKKLPHSLGFRAPRNGMPDALTFTSALLIVLSFPPLNLWPLIWVSLIPWFFALDRAVTLRQAVIQGVWLSIFMSLMVFHWVAHVLTEFGNVPIGVGVLGLILFSFIGEPQFYVFAWIHRVGFYPHSNAAVARSQPVRLLWLGLISACIYVGVDWLCPKIFMDTLGHALSSARHLRQVADLGGASLLSFLVFLVNDAIYFSLKDQSFKRVARQKIILALSLGLVFWTYGYFRLHQIQQILSESYEGVQVAAIQANIGDFEKVASERGVRGAAEQVLGAYSELTRQTMRSEPKPQLVVWPETSYPSTFGHAHSEAESRLETRVQDLVQEIQIPLLFGGYDTLHGKDFNTFFFLSPRERLQAYHKNILLLFGEFIPGAESFEFIRNAFPQVGNFGRGQGPEVVSVPYLDRQGQNQILKVAPIICYEALFSDFVIASARQGSQAIFNITNDGWFGEWGEPQLHLALSTFRSIETRLPLFRSTNTGISALILPDGEIQNATSIGARTVMNSRIPLSPPIPTLLKSWGDWMGPAGLFLGILGFLLLRQIFDSNPSPVPPIRHYDGQVGSGKNPSKESA